jgi:glutamyl-Q tRNA(Asp) synthetase
VKQQNYVGRFAPSPSGPLHYGSLVAATASYLQAKHQQGQWLIRIEDIDPQREVSGAAADILNTLEQFQFEWDQTPLHQSTRINAYRSALNHLIDQKKVYACSCSRKELVNNIQKSALGKRYTGTCANKHLELENTNFNLRLRTEDANISFEDVHYEVVSHNLFKEIGDLIIYRKHDLPSYSLAVSVDDAFQGITEVVRGYDLLAFTPIQIYICQRLKLPIPNFLHVPIIVNQQGHKLSKQTGAKAVDKNNCAITLSRALRDLGQDVPKEFAPEKLTKQDLTLLWSWAIEHWDVDKIPNSKHIVMS